jgi:hypothetical protein
MKKKMGLFFLLALFIAVQAMGNESGNLGATLNLSGQARGFTGNAEVWVPWDFDDASGTIVNGRLNNFTVGTPPGEDLHDIANAFGRIVWPTEGINSSGA